MFRRMIVLNTTLLLSAIILFVTPSPSGADYFKGSISLSGNIHGPLLMAPAFNPNCPVAASGSAAASASGGSITLSVSPFVGSAACSGQLPLGLYPVNYLNGPVHFGDDPTTGLNQDCPAYSQSYPIQHVRLGAISVGSSGYGSGSFNLPMSVANGTNDRSIVCIGAKDGSVHGTIPIDIVGDDHPAEGVPQSGPQGGIFEKELKSRTGHHRHHMPARSTTGFHPNCTPAILMEVSDHIKTKSYGGGDAAEDYRKQQRDKVRAGQLDDAMQMDIDDIHEKFGNKYDEAILQAIDSLSRMCNDPPPP